MEWYYAEAGQHIGPIADTDLRALFAVRRLGPENLVWRPGMAGWQRAGSLAELGVERTSAQSVCTECGRSFPSEDLLSFDPARICAGCKDMFFQRLREQGTAAMKTSGRFGGFWIRVAARLIDSAILWAGYALLLLMWEALMGRVIFNPKPAGSYDVIAMWSALGLIYLLSVAASMTYETWFLYRRGGTLGKLAVGLRVFRSNGERLTLGRSGGRAFAYLLSGLVPLGIGFIMAGIDDEKQALHDRLCDTRVVYRS